MSSSPYQRSLLQVAGPLWVENVLRTSLTTVDVFMLSFYSRDAVAAVGLVNQFVFFVQLMYMMVATGATILMAQYLGAGRRQQAEDTALASVFLVVGFSVALSLVLGLGAPALLSLYGLDESVRGFAVQFLAIYGAGSFFTAVSMLQSALLRVHGDSRGPMKVNVTANFVNIGGNALVLFGWFGLPVLGVVGVACSTVFSQLLACVLLARRLAQHPDLRLPFRRWRQVPSATYRAILSVGVPTAGENLSYNVGQIVILRFVATLGTEAMAAWVYLGTFFRYVFVSAASIGAATQIKVGWWVGQGQEDHAAGRVWRYWALGAAISFAMVLLVNLFQGPLFSIFHPSPAVVLLISACLLAAIALEVGRTFNVIIIPALKGAGDVRFPVFVGMVFQWVVGVGGAWLLGLGFGWGLVGVYAAVAADECTRGLTMAARWHSGRWRGRRFAGAEASAVELKASVPAAGED